MSASMAPNPALGDLFLRTTWIFQAIAAGPVFVCLGLLAVANMFNTFDCLYDFFNHLINALLAAAIIFVVLIQRKLLASKAAEQFTLRFEIAKSVLATALWLWLLLDALFGPRNHGYYRYRSQRVAVAGVSSLLLFILFYPTVIYAVTHVSTHDSESDEPGARNERTPLLQD